MHKFKKALSLILALSMFVTVFTGMNITVFAEDAAQTEVQTYLADNMSVEECIDYLNEKNSDMESQLPSVGVKGFYVDDEESAMINKVLEHDYADSTMVTDSKEAAYDFTSEYYYKQLSAKMKKAYAEVDAAVKAFVKSTVNLSLEKPVFSTVEFSTPLDSMDDVAQLYWVYYYTNPQYFFLMNGYGYYSKPIGIVLYCHSDVAKYAKRSTISAAIDKRTNQYIADVSKLSTKLEQEIAIAKKLSDLITYTFIDGIDQSLMGALYYEKCVCNGYAMAMNYFCNALGIEAITVVSHNHAWNRVYLNGMWYVADVTWMDTATNGSYDYNWLNKSSSYVLKKDTSGSHVLDKSFPLYNNMKLPSCTDDNPADNPAAVPGKPTNIKAVAGDKSITLTWNAVTGATKYRVCYRLEGASSWISKDMTSRNYTITGLTNGRKYQVLVLAGNASGWNKWTASDIRTVIPATIPALPAVKATAGNAKVTLAWNAVSGATKYRVCYRLTGANTWITKDTTARSYTITGLTNDRQYDILVLAGNSVGWSKWASTNIVKATPAGVAPALPSVRTSAGNSRVAVAWNAVSGATKYRVCYRLTGASSWTTKDVTATSYAITGLTNGRKYDIIVLAGNAAGWSTWSASNIVRVTPVGEVPALPAIRYSASNSRIALAWNAVSGATKYRVCYRLTGANTWTTKDVTATTYAITGLTNGRKYDVLVLAGNASGWSKWSSGDIINVIPTA